MSAAPMSPAARAFDAIAGQYDERFGGWLSVAAQRRAVRNALEEAFPPGSELLEIGGGTGDDALWMADRGCKVLMTDASPTMVHRASAKFRGRPKLRAETACAENLEVLERGGTILFDGAWSNFAGLNCVPDLGETAAGLGRLIRPGGSVILVLFGTLCPGEVIVEALRSRPKAMFRRLTRNPVPARIGGKHFTVRYHRAQDVRKAMAPWFSYRGRRGIGILVPPSAAEPWISRHPRLLGILESIDRKISRPLAMFGDHVLYHFVRKDGE